MDLSERPSRPFRRHPWEQARFRFFAGIIAATELPRPVRILDVGSGDGWFASRLGERLGPATEITCWDPAYTPAQLAELSALAAGTIRFSATRPAGAFDLVLLLDVLEHIDDDAGFLARIVGENLAPAAVALVSVPSWSWLFGRHDLQLRHVRRYAPRDATRLLARAGLAIEHQGGLFHSLLLPRLVATVVWHLSRRPDPPPAASLEWRHGAVTSALVAGALAIDGAIAHRMARARIALPGLSWWALARKSR